jgi:Zn-dependent M32 family carboxypeptidase
MERYLCLITEVFNTKTERSLMSKTEVDDNALSKMEKEFSSVRSYLEQILTLQKEILENLAKETKKIEEQDSSSEDSLSGGMSVAVLLKLPDHLRKTMIALSKLIEGRADEVANITGRARAIESGYLNQLVRLGHVKKVRRKHQIYFSVESGA